MSDYEEIKAACLQRSELWEDPEFLAIQYSVFYYQTPPVNFVWMRPKQLFQKPTFIVNNSKVFDVIPGILGDKWLVSCLGVVFSCKGIFSKVVPVDQPMETGYAGIFKFNIWWCGEWKEVLVDDRLPTVNGRLAFLQCASSDQLWPALLEKAYAKLHGSYEGLKYSSMLDGLADLTGGVAEAQPAPAPADHAAFKSLLESSTIVTAFYKPANPDDKDINLELEMNYRILEIKEVQAQEGALHVVRMYRPKRRASGADFRDAVISASTWITIDQRDRQRMTGIGFWVLLKDLKHMFPRIEMVHLDRETSESEPSLVDKNKWQTHVYKNSWRRGVSAGGCRNHADYFHINPQVQIILNEAQTIAVSLNQHSVMDTNVIGFSIYKVLNVFTEPASAGFFKRTKTAVNSPYTNSRQVNYRCQLGPGIYLILPTTFEPRMEAAFTLRIFSHKHISMNVLDNAPEMLCTAVISAPASENNSLTEYEMLFLQLADEHKLLDTFALQELLDACLPNDYIKSCVSIDTCRQIVLTLDKKGIGRITLSDYKDLMCSLKHWQAIFKRHALEKVGVLRAERLRDVLQDTGFVVPEKVMNLLVHRYMRKDGMLRFGDYVSAVLHLQRTFMCFRNKGGGQKSNNIQINLSEWLHSALSC